MRIIAGEFRSRRLKSIPGAATRPTPDRLRETLFDILQTRVQGATFLDAYAGTGAVGIEALSRGAAHAWFLEKNRAALDVIRENLASLDLERRATVVTGPAALTIAHHSADIVFLDPPYDHEREYAAVLEQLAAAPPQLVIAQHSTRVALPENQGGLRRTRVVRQGDNALSFYAAESPAPVWHTEHSVETAADRDFAWSYMSNVANWDDPPAEFHLDGPFAEDSRGTTTMPSQPTREWSLRDVRPPETYTVDAAIAEGATLSCTWRFDPADPGRTRLTQTLVLSGENAAACRDQVAEAFTANLAPGMSRIAAAIAKAALAEPRPPDAM
jgi:16S rRNA (guanine(966)-N(2))-methyltransferase RsmD